MYKVKDNAEAQLQFGISSVATTLVVKEGQGVKFPEVPFLVVLNKRNSDGEITKSEKVEVSAVSGDQFTISRGYEGTTPSDFSADDFVSLFVLARHIIEIQEFVQEQTENVDEKLEKLSEKMESAEGQISQLVEAGVSDHLEESGIVGEKYTLENQLFKQYTPKAEDSTIAINVGDIDKNKEIHIQRIGSGIASNQLKLKMKKSGAPTTSVIVEIRKGVKVDVSDTEAYRYGNEVIASTTIAYTEFTTEWKEFTLTLNNQFGATKGELLDIVVYQQGGIVNSTNYYQIACDSTQYSEAFSYVSVNGSSRVREKLMPYCISEGFAQGLLVKATDLELKVDDTRTVYTDNTKTSAWNAPATKTFTIAYSGEFNLSVVSDSYYQGSNISFVLSGHTISTQQNSGVHTLDFSAKKGEIMEITISGTGREVSLNQLKIDIKKFHLIKKGLLLYPQEVVGIAHQLLVPFFGIINGNWVGKEQIDTTLSKTATTGTIPPANAVGYVSIIGADGKKYKIRVYGE